MKKLVIIKLILWLIKFIGRDVVGFYSWELDKLSDEILDSYTCASKCSSSEQVKGNK